MTEENGVQQSKMRGRPPSHDPDQRRKAILLAAYGAFIELGFARTTTAEVAARAKTSKRTLYSLFADKRALFAAVIKEYRCLILDLPRPANEDESLLETLVRIFRLDIDHEAEQQREAMLNLIVRESILFPELADFLYENEVIRSREALIDWLMLEMQSGRIPKGDVAVYAGMLMDVVFGALLPRRRLESYDEREERTAHIKERLAIFLKGIGVVNG